MRANIAFTLLRENDVVREYVFTGPTRCTVGRSPDSDICIPHDVIYQDVSREHCILDLDPPRARVRDLDSRNGTFVNGVRIGQSQGPANPDETTPNPRPWKELKDGDEIRMGRSTILRVSVVPLAELSPHDRDVRDAMRHREELRHASAK
jgi:pSer/pThr/pTyr-binding forkhead associated (FHA) protein